jgi:hypothetical protein
MAKQILMIVLGWVIPLLLTSVLSKAPKVQKWINENKIAASIALSCLISLLLSITVIWLYDQFVLPRYAVAFAHEGGGQCPSGYTDEGTILLGRWKDAPDWFQSPKDTHIPYPGLGNTDWLLDHIKLCLKLP